MTSLPALLGALTAILQAHPLCDRVASIDYAYQLFVDAPLLRWDNKEEFPYISTYPHHHHDEYGKVHSSPLVGDPVRDVQIVLQVVAEFISGRSKL